MDKELYNNYLKSLLIGDKQTCQNIVLELIQKGEAVESIYVNLFQRSMYKVGILWEHNKISVAVEHLATSITESLMLLVYPKILSQDKIGKKAIVTSVKNEYHQIGARMVADTFELNGWDSYFLGSNTPTADILLMIEEKQPDILCISISIYYNMNNLIALLKTIRSSNSDLQIITGGQAFRWGGKNLLKQFYNVEYLESLNILQNRIKAK